MEPLPENRIDRLGLKPEQLKSKALEHPPVYPEANRISITKDKWDALVEKYGEEKVGGYYKLVFAASIDVKPKPPVIGNG
jgi:hypothetical protein